MVHKNFRFVIKKCTESNKHSSVTQCANDGQINDFIDNLNVYYLDISDFVDFTIHEPNKTPIFSQSGFGSPITL